MFAVRIRGPGAAQHVHQDWSFPLWDNSHHHRALHYQHPDMEFIKWFAPVRFPKFSILPEKTRKSQHFRQTIDNIVCFSHLFRTNCQSFANFYSNTKWLQLFCEKPSLNWANFTERVIFALILNKILPQTKNIFYWHNLCCHIVIVVVVMIRTIRYV